MALPFRFVTTLPFLILLLYFLFYSYHVGRCIIIIIIIIIIITTVVFCGLEVPKSLNFMGAPNYYKHK